MKNRSDSGSFESGIRMAGVMLLIAAAVFFFAGNSKREMRARCTETSEGIVTDVQKVRKTKGSGDKKTRYTVYKTDYYFFADDQRFTGSSEIKENLVPPEKGSIVTVNYDPADPAEAHYTKYDTGAVGYLVTAGIMGAAGIAGVVYSLLPRRKKDRL